MLSGTRSIIIQSPVGSGKTLLTGFMLKAASEKGMASWFTVHRRELIKQSIDAFNEVGVPHGVIASGFPENPNALIQIGSIQTLARRFKNLPMPKLIVWDEAHHTAALSWAKIHNSLSDAFHIGLTATPERLDGKGLRCFFSELVSGPSVTWLIENGFLAPYKLFAPPGIDTGGIKKRMGDFAIDELERAADKSSITGNAVDHYIKLSAGKRAIVFCVSIEHSKHVVSEFLGRGIAAEHVDGETEKNERDARVSRFRDGKTLILSNVELFGEGFDLPEIETAILLRPTHSLCLFLQQTGRALRPAKGKTQAIILDHAGNTARHGLPDEHHSWSLDGREGRTQGNGKTKSVKICPSCYAAQWPGRTHCAFCGFEFEIKSRKVAQEAGDLVEVNLARVRFQRRREQRQCGDLESLIALGRQRGYKRPELWARYVVRARNAKRVLR